MEIPTPEELNKRQENADNTSFEQAVRILTESLIQQYVANGGPVDTAVPAAFANERVRRRIVSEFSKKGWNVHFSEFKFDEMDGDHYEVRIQASAASKN